MSPYPHSITTIIHYYNHSLPIQLPIYFPINPHAISHLLDTLDRHDIRLDIARIPDHPIECLRDRKCIRQRKADRSRVDIWVGNDGEHGGE